jgi:hypothetical protein
MEHAMTDLLSVLTDMRNGAVAVDCNTKFNEVLKAVLETGGKGELSIKLFIKPSKMGMGGAVIEVETAHECKAKKPELEVGLKFPPVTVFYDGADYWLADGFHRVTAALQADLKEIAADVHQGTREDAQWYSFSANKANGLRSFFFVTKDGQLTRDDPAQTAMFTYQEPEQKPQQKGQPQ